MKVQNEHILLLFVCLLRLSPLLSVFSGRAGLHTHDQPAFKSFSGVMATRLCHFRGFHLVRCASERRPAMQQIITSTYCGGLVENRKCFVFILLIFCNLFFGYFRMDSQAVSVSGFPNQFFQRKRDTLSKAQSHFLARKNASFLKEPLDLLEPSAVLELCRTFRMSQIFMKKQHRQSSCRAPVAISDRRVLPVG